ncbi:hypothetical protein KCP73_13025 [Salmonella enterica subsp. enterica]|nr:hypothetical protein KCP73_13025 [Salmonella enterica subsp. enterica]
MRPAFRFYRVVAATHQKSGKRGSDDAATPVGFYSLKPLPPAGQCAQGGRDEIMEKYGVGIFIVALSQRWGALPGTAASKGR